MLFMCLPNCLSFTGNCCVYCLWFVYFVDLLVATCFICVGYSLECFVDLIALMCIS